MLSHAHPNASIRGGVTTTPPVRGRPIQVGDGFSALSFDHRSFEGLMDPLVMVDHFTMAEPTFGPHPHAGMSAVSILFEDSTGFFHNRDSLGNDVDLRPGDLYWLKSGRGAVHDEKPRSGSRVHALQAFVNLPVRFKRDSPATLHVPASEMPVLRAPGYRIRVMLGVSNGVEGASSPALPFTVLDAQLQPRGEFVHSMPADADAWLLAVDGDVEVAVDDATIRLLRGSAIAVRSGPTTVPIALRTETGAQLALLEGTPVRENFVQHGPFVMSNTQELRAVVAAHAAGELGSID